MRSFFDKTYQTPKWFTQWLETKQASQTTARRSFLKSAAGVTAISLTSSPLLAKSTKIDQQVLRDEEPWLTLNSVLEHLLPKSALGPSSHDINALAYLMNVYLEQPISEDEKSFLFKGVGWLNGYSESEMQMPFIALSVEKKETVLRGISQSQAGENWLNTLIIYLFEAMLSPPSYGGNPDGIGWRWLQHQAGFPLPEKGSRYYELPVIRAKVITDETPESAIGATAKLTKVHSTKRLHKA